MTSESLDRRVAARLSDVAPTVRWELLEQLMQTVDATAQRRARRWWPEVVSLPLRRDLPNAMVLLLLVAALAIGGVLALTLGRQAPTPPPIDIRTSSLPVPPSLNPADVMVEGVVEFNGSLVAIGTAVPSEQIGSADDAAMVWRSADGTRWTQVQDSSFAGARLSGIASNGTTLVAVGDRSPGRTRSTAWVSTDGIGWRPFNTSVPLFAGPIAYAYGRFFASGCDLAAQSPCDVYSSADGEQWIREAAGGTVIRAIKPTRKGLYVVGGGANAKVFDPPFSLLYDGRRWERAVPNTDTAGFGIADVVERGGDIVGIGIYDAATPQFGVGFWYSRADGASWVPTSFIGDFYSVPWVVAVPGNSNVIALEDGGDEPIPMELHQGLLTPVVPVAQAPAPGGASTSAILRLDDGSVLAVGRAPTSSGSAPTVWRLTGPKL